MTTENQLDKTNTIEDARLDALASDRMRLRAEPPGGFDDDYFFCQPVPDASEREHCKQVALEHNDDNAPIAHKLADAALTELLLRERAVARAGGRNSILQDDVHAYTALKAENERLRQSVHDAYGSDSVYEHLRTKHTALVKAARAVHAELVRCLADEDYATPDGAGTTMLSALAEALNGES